MKESLERNDGKTLAIIAQNDEENGILGFVNCLKLEPHKKNVSAFTIISLQQCYLTFAILNIESR